MTSANFDAFLYIRTNFEVDYILIKCTYNFCHSIKSIQGDNETHLSWYEFTVQRICYLILSYSM